MKRLLMSAMVIGLMATPAAYAQDTAYEIFTKPDHGPGNVAVSPEGRVFVTLHQLFNPETHVIEVFNDGTHKNFPK